VTQGRPRCKSDPLADCYEGYDTNLRLSACQRNRPTHLQSSGRTQVAFPTRLDTHCQTEAARHGPRTLGTSVAIGAASPIRCARTYMPDTTPVVPRRSPRSGPRHPSGDSVVAGRMSEDHETRCCLRGALQPQLTRETSPIGNVGTWFEPPLDQRSPGGARQQPSPSCEHPASIPSALRTPTRRKDPARVVNRKPSTTNPSGDSMS
jgi:hypothetical protein